MNPSSLLSSHPGPIVLVDDERELAEAVGSMLRGVFGEARVRCTSDSREALVWLQKEKPALLISDARMPGLSGFDLFTQVQEWWGATPTIIITAFPTEDIVSGARRGAFVYLAKPFSFRALLETIEKLEPNPRPASSKSSGGATLAELLQLYAISGSTGMIQIRFEEHRGGIWFERGKVVHAQADTL